MQLKASSAKAVGWYVIARNGDIRVRVGSGMQLGEGHRGELSLRPEHAIVELEVGDDQRLTLRTTSESYEMRVRGKPEAHPVSLSPHTVAVITFPAYTVVFTTQFEPPDLDQSLLEIKVVPLPGMRPTGPASTPAAPPGTEATKAANPHALAERMEKLQTRQADNANQAIAGASPAPKANRIVTGSSLSWATSALAAAILVTAYLSVGPEPGSQTSQPTSIPEPQAPVAAPIPPDLSAPVATIPLAIDESAGAPASTPADAAEVDPALASIRDLLAARPDDQALRSALERLTQELSTQPEAGGPQPESMADAAQPLDATQTIEATQTIDAGSQPRPTNAATLTADIPIQAPEPASPQAGTPTQLVLEAAPAASEATVAKPIESAESLSGEPTPSPAPLAVAQTLTAEPAEQSEPAAPAPTTPEALPRDETAAQATPPVAEAYSAADSREELPIATAAEPPTVASAVPEVAPSEAQSADTAQTAELQPDAHLQAAQTALANDQLASAFALFKRALETAADSQAAQAGIEAVRTALLAHARSLVSGNDMAAAFGALQDAEVSGADATTIQALRAQAQTRQHLLDARDGVFTGLFPMAQLTPIRRTAPQYPSEAPEGTVASIYIEMTVTESGEVRDIEILGEAAPYFGRAARRAIRRWRFQPVTLDGTPVAVRTSVRLTFQG
ncbi:MAG: hypothetical protein CMQ49_08050 [Gammaproteobacteria bacterium]|nr:hypothetical protein [Gammaproteobacteria bacterium]